MCIRDSYDGTLLAVSHDRYFINRLATKIYAFENGGLVQKESFSVTANADIAVQKEKACKNEDYRRKKEKLSEERKKANRIAFLEKKIAELEDEVAGLEASQLAAADDYEQLMKLGEQIEQKKQETAACYEEWEALSL